MKTTIIKNNKIKYIAILLTGLLLGWILFGLNKSQYSTDNTEHVHQEATEDVWTCSMHPQIRQQKPGDCPICGMDLIPLDDNEGEDIPDVITLSDRALALANIQTSMVHAVDNIQKEIRLQGKVEIDERQIAALTAHFPGRIERLFVTYEGAQIQAGQKLADIYSPELVTAQKELLEAIRLEGNDSNLAKAARNKLRLWKIEDATVDNIISSGKVTEVLSVYAQSSGIVTRRNVAVGDYVNEGEVMFEIANLNKLWVLFDAYQEDLPFISIGDKIDIEISSLPNRHFSAHITYIDPVIDPQTRVASVRAEIQNPGRLLKPEMFAYGLIYAQMETSNSQMAVPSSAVMWTGKRSIVYVHQQSGDQTSFQMREVQLGERVGESYIIDGGLQAGEKVVTHGTFTVDAAAQLANKSSMMNQDVQAIKTGGPLHDHMMHDVSDGKKEAFFVAGNCSMCKDRIEEAVRELEGIYNVSWNVEDKMLEVRYHPEKLDLINIHHAVAEVGHDTRKVKAPDNVYENLHGCCKYERVKQTDTGQIKTTSFKVFGNCGMCEDRIETTALELSGVQKASWNQNTKMLEISYEPSKLDIASVHEAIASSGHDTEKEKAPDNVYNELPGCCQYTREQ